MGVEREGGGCGVEAVGGGGGVGKRCDRYVIRVCNIDRYVIWGWTGREGMVV